MHGLAILYRTHEGTRLRDRQLLKPLCFLRDIYEFGGESRMKQPVAENYNQCSETQQKQLKQRKESSNLDSPFPKQAIIEEHTDCQPQV